MPRSVRAWSTAWTLDQCGSPCDQSRCQPGGSSSTGFTPRRSPRRPERRQLRPRAGRRWANCVGVAGAGPSHSVTASSSAVARAALWWSSPPTRRDAAHPAPQWPRAPAPAGLSRGAPRSVKELIIAAGAVAGMLPPGRRPQRVQTGVLTVRGTADQARRTRDPQGRRGGGAAGMLAAGRMARHRAGASAVLAVQPARRHSADHAGAAGQAALAHRVRLPGDETGPGPGPLRRPNLERMAPPRHPRLRRPRLLHPPATGPNPHKRRRRPESLPGRPRDAVTPRGLDRRLSHLSPRVPTAIPTRPMVLSTGSNTTCRSGPRTPRLAVERCL